MQRFPRARRAGPLAAGSQDRAPMRPTILLVEDDDGIREPLALLLEEEGYDVRHARDGEVAFRALGTATTPALIVLDLMMPICNGVEFRQRQLASSFASIPVVVISAAADRIEDPELFSGCIVLRKPFAISSFLEAVAEHFRPAA
jgi:DNA-binding response OmpR family regulator